MLKFGLVAITLFSVASKPSMPHIRSWHCGNFKSQTAMKLRGGISKEAQEVLDFGIETYTCSISDLLARPG